ncbi:hypothetical protein EJ04DRAFT_335520 [Polyplosphaeria fusca]|uniref:Uncharacterized protein n=1 Tax=Polyplosphaeria fusca TaxID=682080 RepID=A0A9P4RA60_9PLEO|nr:hypothetical protein EJ04DRAFT_335520 [Polyplosphaeria fusca]
MFFNFMLLYDMTNRQASNGLPYKSHPLYKIRLATIVVDLIGLAFNLLSVAAGDYYYSTPAPFIFALIFLFLSLSFVVWDLVTWAVHKTSSCAATLPAPATSVLAPSQVQLNDGDKYKWPSKRLLVIDIVLAVLLQWLFWAALVTITSSYNNRYGSETIQSYGNLANLVASILHAIAFWKELIARKQEGWLRRLSLSLAARPCDECGHVNTITEEDLDNTVKRHGKQTNARVDPSLSKTILAKWARSLDAQKLADDVERSLANATRAVSEAEDDANEAATPLLVTPEESGTEVGESSKGYGTLSESVSSVPETVVRKKDKGKKRLVEVD